MPNSRSPGKEVISAWLDADLKQRLMEYAKREGETISSVVVMVLKEKLAHGDTYGAKTTNQRKP